MIAASPNKFASLELVQLTLSLLSRSAADVPLEIKQDLMQIILQAQSLLADPIQAADGDKDWQPESISLALLMRRQSEIADALSNVRTIENLDAAIAKRVYDQIESSVAA